MYARVSPSQLDNIQRLYNTTASLHSDGKATASNTVSSMKIKKLGKSNLKLPKAFAIGKKSARSDDSIAASELLDEHLGKSEKQGW